MNIALFVLALVALQVIGVLVGRAWSRLEQRAAYVPHATLVDVASVTVCAPTRCGQIARVESGQPLWIVLPNGAIQYVG